MNPPPPAVDMRPPGQEVRSLHWLLDRLLAEAPGIRSVAVVSSDGVLLVASDPAHPGAGAAPAADAADAGDAPQSRRTAGADLATIVSGLGSLTLGAAGLMDAGAVRHTMVSMAEGSLFLMSISDGSLLGVHAAPDCDVSVIAYHMALFVGRAGHFLTPELRSRLLESA